MQLSHSYTQGEATAITEITTNVTLSETDMNWTKSDVFPFVFW